MTVHLREPATDWTSQTLEERLRLCTETLFVHGLLKPGTYHHATTQLRDRIDAQRDRADVRRIDRELRSSSTDKETDHG